MMVGSDCKRILLLRRLTNTEATRERSSGLPVSFSTIEASVTSCSGVLTGRSAMRCSQISCTKWRCACCMRWMICAQIIQRMQQAHLHLVQEIWEHRMADLPVKTPEQLVTLASIVEKETGKPDERSRVASVFVNRLKSKMRLQSDPTIIYGLTGGKGSLGRPILKSEIEQPTPYNTYVIDGLPPGPIANPGRASLDAAANPARTKYLYFVADGSGGHVFSENYDAHQKNVARLRVIEHGTTPPAPPATKP